MTCKICDATTEHETCSEACRIKLECARIAWDRLAKKVGVNGYYEQRYSELLRQKNKHGANVMLKEWKEVKAGMEERP